MSILASCLRIIRALRIFIEQVIVSLHPLYKLQIILILGLGQLLNINMLLYFTFAEGLL